MRAARGEGDAKFCAGAGYLETKQRATPGESRLESDGEIDTDGNSPRVATENFRSLCFLVQHSRQTERAKLVEAFWVRAQPSTGAVISL